jgi:hypothetical protein
MMCTGTSSPRVVYYAIHVLLVRRHIQRIAVINLTQQINARCSRETWPEGRFDVLYAVDSQAVAATRKGQFKLRGQARQEKLGLTWSTWKPAGSPNHPRYAEQIHYNRRVLLTSQSLTSRAGSSPHSSVRKSGKLKPC